jgi:hypothetical protein
MVTGSTMSFASMGSGGEVVRRMRVVETLWMQGGREGVERG